MNAILIIINITSLEYHILAIAIIVESIADYCDKLAVNLLMLWG